MKILLTGGSGFVGKYISRQLQHQALVMLSRHITKPGDIQQDLRRPFALPQSFDTVIHGAGLAHGKPGSFNEVNIQGTRNLLAALSRPPQQLVYISSVAVYGLTSGTMISEHHPTVPTDAYGSSKLKAEQMCRTWCEKHSVRFCALRLPLVVGLEAPGNFGRMVQQLRQGWYLGVGEGAARRSMVLADDLASIVLRAAEVGGTYHLTDGVHPSFCELEDAICQAFGKKSPNHLPLWVARGMAVTGEVMAALRFLSTFSQRYVSKNDIYLDLQ